MLYALYLDRVLDKWDAYIILVVPFFLSCFCRKKTTFNLILYKTKIEQFVFTFSSGIKTNWHLPVSFLFSLIFCLSQIFFNSNDFLKKKNLIEQTTKCVRKAIDTQVVMIKRILRKMNMKRFFLCIILFRLNETGTNTK